MPAVRRRNARARRGLTPEERHFLRYGSTICGPDGPPFSPDRDIDPDPAIARAAWREHREELLADAAPYIPWAARRFEGMAGDISPYDHLRAVR